MVTGHTLRVVNRRGNSCRFYSPGSRYGYKRDAGSICPASVHLTLVHVGARLVNTLANLVDTFHCGTSRCTSIVGVNHARLRSTIPVSFNRRFGTCTGGLRRRVLGLRHGIGLLRRVGVNNATVNANLGTIPNFTGLYTTGLDGLANRGFRATASLMRTAPSANTCMDCSSTLGHLTVGLSGVYGSLHLVTSNPHYNLGRVGLPTGTPNSSVVPNGIGPIVPRMAGRIYFGMVNGSTAIDFTTRTNRLRLGMVRPVVARDLFRDLA